MPKLARRRSPRHPVKPPPHAAAELLFKNVDKVFYPKTRFTKGDVIRYYLEVARWLLPHLANRPITLKRYPDGVHGQFFYEKDAPAFTPEWVPTFPVPRREGGEPIRYILINDAQVLAWCANLGTIELHPFLHRVPDIATPTALAFDFDPGEGADWRDCARVAMLVREILDDLRLKAYPKVSGSKGMQLYVPLNTPVTYAATRAFAKAIAELLAQRHPDRVVSEMAKALRRGKVFIDWSQNSDFKTTVGVYSLRAKREEPFVSMPVTWSEVEAATSKAASKPLFFSPDQARRRLEAKGDLFAAVLTEQQQLPAAFAADVRSPPAGRASRTLRTYAAKRDFRVTPEPGALPTRSAQGSRRRFVIQKHAASHLHYDLRLEMHDTLKSWAVPKGLPYALDDRRSAFATEDHPIDYLSFEGVIPAGQYGGGTVMVWDIGTYDVVEGNYWKGFLRVHFRGRKVKGEWTLSRIEERNGKARWLIAKSGRPMRAIGPKRDDRSALTSRSMAQIAAAQDAVWQSNRGEGESASGSRIAAASSSHATTDRRRSPATPRSGRERPRAKPSCAEPEFIEPMMARPVTALPQGREWIYEVKWDGYRALAVKHGTNVRLLSRKNKSLAADFPDVAASIRKMAAESALVDGEIVALDSEGRPQFQSLQHRAAEPGVRIVYYVYDLLHLNGEDLRSRPLEDRKRALERIVAGTDIRFSADLLGEPERILAQARRLKLEGIVAKRRDGAYESGERSGSWQKLRLSPEQDFVIGGFKPGNPVESLLVGYYVGGKLMYAGKVRQGLNPRLRRELGRLLEPLRTAACPFANLPNSKKSHFGEGVTAEQMEALRWTKPQLVAQVSFAEWTRGGNLRHPTFLRLRDDKTPREVVRET